jgi:hypothetical protein
MECAEPTKFHRKSGMWGTPWFFAGKNPNSKCPELVRGRSEESIPGLSRSLQKIDAARARGRGFGGQHEWGGTLTTDQRTN